MSSKYLIAVNADTLMNTMYNYYMVDASSNDITLTLPDIESDAIGFTVKRNDNNANYSVTVIPSGAGTIDNLLSKVITPNGIIKFTSLGSNWYSNKSYGIGKEINIVFNTLWGSQLRSYILINNISYSSLGTFLYNGSEYYGSDPVKIEIIYSVDSDVSTDIDFTVQFHDITNTTIIATIGPITQNGTNANLFESFTTSFSSVPNLKALIEIDGKLNTGSANVRLHSVKVILN